MIESEKRFGIKSHVYQQRNARSVDNYLSYNLLYSTLAPYLCLKKEAMKLFNHKISLIEILREIPDSELSRIARESRVDYCSKVLSGKLMFYLLLYGILRIDRLSQRGLCDAFSSPMFKLIFETGGKRSISHSSISDRLSTIGLDFFKTAYDCIYRHFSSLYTSKEIAGYYLQRVDSSLVAEAGNKLVEGMTCGNEHKKKKMIKYTINFDGMFASFGNVYSQAPYANESLAMPEAISGHFKKVKDHASVYLFDRGLSSAVKLGELRGREGLLFIGRLIENRKLKILEECPVAGQPFTHGELLQDNKANIYGTVKTVTRKGDPVRKQVLQPEVYRVIRFKPKNGTQEILLITNAFELTADDIASMYKRRWDIEVFFRFLKQELNFSHFLSLNENGIQVVLYMTLITAMLVMIYKRENEIGYKTATRRMGIELENLILAIIVVQSGGDLRKVDLPDP